MADLADNIDTDIEIEDPESPKRPKKDVAARHKKRRVHEIMDSDDSLSVSSFKVHKSKKIEDSDEGIAGMAESVTSMARSFRMPPPAPKVEDESNHVLWAKLAAQKLAMLPN